MRNESREPGAGSRKPIKKRFVLPVTGYRLPCSRFHQSGDLLDLERFDDVANLHVLVAVEGDSALEPLLDLGDVVLEAPERGDLALVDDPVVAQEADLGRAGDRALGDVAPGDHAELRHPEGVADFGAAARDLLQG